ncbi:hydrogenase maturation protein HypF [Nitratiruptor sp. YY08-26]|uniref:carbamoyltransferase HypF n=1 Tax=unclassified Nitratiruptor TaxID=2624044 RepID=UPI001915B938|nr:MULTISPECIES: carbamoyltransferase HypF [unclassified Nitratiruptor]BCD62382.1 hydrogenase maturation protein HypF [Nitratiruptor sp. YY08-13]BCD66318.1 hydrogenase maturation protein HypF [Nitratiruptor sp. YY08-26]
MRIFVKGIVQGVGFRPFVYKLANELGLTGFIRNCSDGVEIVIEGKNEELFLEYLQSKLPPLAKIFSLQIQNTPIQNFQQFTIIQSQEGQKETFLSPDISICDACLQDLFNPNSRRYHYPLINCTNCGPRFTIIKDLPYDRKNTSMAKFPMCQECQREYHDPNSRFFHAQPIGCNSCGPKLFYESLSGYEAIEAVAKDILTGDIVAIKGVGGYHLVCLPKSAHKLRQIKRRAKKPFALMFKSIDKIKEICDIDENEEKLILSKERPIVIVKAKKNFVDVAPDIDRLGVFLPYSPIYYLLFSFIDSPLVVTSANISDEPIVKEEENIKRFTQKVLYYDREIIRSCDDSVVVSIDKKPLFYRLSRGYAPKSFFVDKKLPSILAVGARQKNTIALSFANNIILSPHIGDIKNIQSYDYFLQVIEDFKAIYDFSPEVVICDKHPGYETTQYAKSLDITTIKVQHHLAHIYAAKAEMELTHHPLSQNLCLGFSWDGTGYGDDGKVWGGEVFVGDERKYHFDYLKIAGGEKAIKDIRLIAWSLLKKYGFEVEDKLFHLAYEKNINCFETSSVGRVFDAVAFLAGLCKYQEYEGYSGLLVEKAYQDRNDRYEFYIQDGIITIDFLSLIKDKKADIPTKFLNTLTAIIIEIAKREKLPVILSGGVFQNKTLLENTIKKLQQNSIPYFFPTQIPINDGGISLGQLWYALENYK